MDAEMCQDGLEPLPETTEAVNELDPLVTDDDLLEQLIAAGGRVRGLVPECVGMSLTLREQGVTFTLVASDAGSARLDAAQYLAGGPCVSAATSGTVIDLSTRRRRVHPVFAAAEEQDCVASTLSLPLLDHSAGGAESVSLYGSSPHCFDGHHEELAQILGAWAGGAVMDADLSFATRVAAQQAPASCGTRPPWTSRWACWPRRSTSRPRAPTGVWRTRRSVRASPRSMSPAW